MTRERSTGHVRSQTVSIVNGRNCESNPFVVAVIAREYPAAAYLNKGDLDRLSPLHHNGTGCALTRLASESGSMSWGSPQPLKGRSASVTCAHDRRHSMPPPVERQDEIDFSITSLSVISSGRG
jgi:hypothetical protein